jgi:hypothetical protein
MNMNVNMSMNLNVDLEMDMDMHRWACLLKQQTSVTVYRLPTKENKLNRLPLSVCRKQTEVCRLRFQFSANEGKFVVSPFVAKKQTVVIRLQTD